MRLTARHRRWLQVAAVLAGCFLWTMIVFGLSDDDLAAGSPRRGAGCPECGDTGYRGRTAVYEVLDVDAPMRSVLMTDPSESAIAAHVAGTGMLRLRGAAIRKAMRGETTFEEALRVTSR